MEGIGAEQAVFIGEGYLQCKALCYGWTVQGWDELGSHLPTCWADPAWTPDSSELRVHWKTWPSVTITNMKYKLDTGYTHA